MTLLTRTYGPNDLNGLGISMDPKRSISGHIAALRKRFERDRPTLPSAAIELGNACLLHVENYRLGREPDFINRRTLEVIDAFAESLRQEAARRD